MRVYYVCSVRGASLRLEGNNGTGGQCQHYMHYKAWTDHMVCYW